MTIAIRVDRTLSTPLRVQVRQALAQAIADGRLPPGTRLPSTRDLAAQLGVSTLTVAHAYQDLTQQGLVVAEVGRGTFVRPPAPTPPPTATAEESVAWPRYLPNDRAAPRTVAVQEIIGTAHALEQIELIGGYPHVTMPVARGYVRALGAIIRDRPELGAKGGSSLGQPALRAALAAWLSADAALDRPPVSPDEVLVTRGAHAGLDLVARTLLRPGDAVVVEEPTYFAALDLFESQGASLLPAPIDEHGIRTDTVDYLLRTYHPKLIYLSGRGSNPSGVALSPDRQRELLSLAADHGVPIVDDEANSAYTFTDALPPPLGSVDTQGLVIRVGSLAKLIGSGVRLGYVVAPDPLRRRLVDAKWLFDRLMPVLEQTVVATYLNSGAFARDLRAATATYRERRAATLAALAAHAPVGARWTQPAAGLTLWVEFPDDVSETLLVHASQRANVALLPGSVFAVRRLTHPGVRLGFGHNEPALLTQAIERLCAAWRAGIAQLGAAGRAESLLAITP